MFGKKKKNLGLPVAKDYGHTFADLLFFIVTVALPGSLFGFLDKDFFYFKGSFDLNFIVWLMSMLFFLFYGKNVIFIMKNNIIKILLVVNVYVICRFVETLLSGQSFKETFIIFRTFFSPLSALALLCYVYSMNRERIYRYYIWMIITMSIQGVFFIFYHVTGFNVFGSKIYYVREFKEKLVSRYYAAMPQKAFVVFPIALLQFFSTKKVKWLFPFVIMVISVILVATRSSTILVAVYIFVITLLYYRIRLIWLSIDGLKILFAVILVFLLLNNFINEQFEYIMLRFDNILTYNLENDANYNLRISLIEQSLSDISVSFWRYLFGYGYVRVASAGEYDFVLGGDTNLPGVIYTEGIMGLMLRLSLFVYCLFVALRDFFSKKYSSANILIIASIIAMFVGLLQSTAFRYIDAAVVNLVMLQLYGSKSKNRNLNA